MLVSSSLQLYSNDTEAITNAAGATDSHSAAISEVINLTDGSSTGTAGANTGHKVGDLVFTATTNSQNIDMTAFAGGINSVAINFSCVRKLFIFNQDTSNSVSVTFNSGTNGATNILNGVKVIGPQGVLCVIEPANGATISSTSKIIGFVAGANTAAVRVTAVGQGA